MVFMCMLAEKLSYLLVMPLVDLVDLRSAAGSGVGCAEGCIRAGRLGCVSNIGA